MRAFLEVFKLEFFGLIRSRVLAILSAVSLAWMFAAPFVFRADGTEEGAREMCVRFSLGGVTALLAVSLLIAAAGSLSRERAAKRLQLTIVRPVRLFVLVIGKIAALSLAGTIILALAATVEAVRQDPSRRCSSVYRPVLPSPAEEAAAMYDVYMADPETPPAVKKAKKSVVLRLLTQRAVDHFQTIGTNGTVTWKFSTLQPSTLNFQPSLSMRFRFTNMYEMRDEVRGRLLVNGDVTVVSNITQAVVKIPLQRTTDGPQVKTISFVNDGVRPVMLRPRKDVELLVEADGFVMNLARAYLQLVGVLTLLVAFGVFLGAGLNRSVAVFVAIVVLALSEMAPSVVEQYPSQLETERADAIGLTLARFSAAVTHPIGSLSPLSALAADERIEPCEVVRTLMADGAIFPILFALLAALLLPRKQDDY